MKELLKEVVEGLKKVRCYSLKETLQDYLDGKITADEAQELLIEFNTNFKNLDIDEEGNPILYHEFIKIGEVDISIRDVKSITTDSYYDFGNHKVLYRILLNKSSNDFNPNSNICIKYDTRKERDLVYLKLRDGLSIFGRIRFN